MNKNMRAIRNFVFGLARPKHRCNSCDHTWKPRGSGTSARCPSCRSEDIKFATSAGLKALAVVIAFIVAGIWALSMSSTTVEVHEPNTVRTVDPIVERCETQCKRVEKWDDCMKVCVSSARKSKRAQE